MNRSWPRVVVGEWRSVRAGPGTPWVRTPPQRRPGEQVHPWSFVLVSSMHAALARRTTHGRLCLAAWGRQTCPVWRVWTLVRSCRCLAGSDSKCFLPNRNRHSELVSGCSELQDRSDPIRMRLRSFIFIEPFLTENSLLLQKHIIYKQLKKDIKAKEIHTNIIKKQT